MASITQVAETMQRVLSEGARQAGTMSGFVQRRSKLGGAEFAQTLTLGWLSNPGATLEELSQTAATVGVPISAQGLDQRFSPTGAACLKLVLEEAVRQMIEGPAVMLSILQRFSGVYVQDSTIVDLPLALAAVWSGCGSGSGQGQAALKVEVRLDLLGGGMVGPLLEDGRVSDAVSQIQGVKGLEGSLRIADVGYWSLPVMQQIAQAGGYWLSRVRNVIKILTPDGKAWDLLDFLQSSGSNQIDCAVRLSAQHATPARLLAVRVPQEVADRRRAKLHREALRRQEKLSQRSLALADWTILVTNVPEALLSLREALLLLRIRWQVELLFKLWKSQARIDEWRSQKPWRILCEVYAKLLGVLLQHWLFLLSFWQFPNRSWVKASQTIRRHALHLASSLADQPLLERALHTLQTCLESGCRINKRKTDLRTFQLLQSLSPQALA